jgi:hypothetical protein
VSARRAGESERGVEDEDGGLSGVARPADGRLWSGRGRAGGDSSAYYKERAASFGEQPPRPRVIIAGARLGLGGHVNRLFRARRIPSGPLPDRSRAPGAPEPRRDAPTGNFAGQPRLRFDFEVPFCAPTSLPPKSWARPFSPFRPAASRSPRA